MKNQNKLLSTEPAKTSGWALFGKFLIGLLVWCIISILLFIILSFVWGIFVDTMSQKSEFVIKNPMLPLLILFVGFLASFLGNLSVAWIYGLFFGDRYTSISKTIGILLLTNGILFVFFIPIYLMFSSDINTLFVLLGLHIIFSIFVSNQQVETISKPNHGPSSLVGTTLWFVFVVLVYSIVWKIANVWSNQNQIYLLLLTPSIIWFSLMPLGFGIRERIYYKMYELWNNWFYVSWDASEEIKPDLIDENDDINIDLQ